MAPSDKDSFGRQALDHLLQLHELLLRVALIGIRGGKMGVDPFDIQV